MALPRCSAVDQGVALQPENLILMVVGIVLGVLIGVLPRLLLDLTEPAAAAVVAATAAIRCSSAI